MPPLGYSLLFGGYTKDSAPEEKTCYVDIARLIGIEVWRLIRYFSFLKKARRKGQQTRTCDY
jgi:hypothetical protein